MLERALGFGLFVTLVSAPSLAQVPVRGIVAERGGEVQLEGARVTLLDGGVRKVAETLSTAGGHFTLEVPAGRYDLRVQVPGYLAQTTADLKLEEGQALERSIDLVSFDTALRERGIEPEWIADQDRDFVPDRFERQLRCDESLADSDGDGVGDGSKEWLGLGTRGGRSSPEIAGFPWTGELARLPGFAPPPVPLRFARVPGASGYLLELIDDEGEVFHTDSVDFESGHLVVGEGVLTSWNAPASLGAGKYGLRLSCYAVDFESPIGASVETSFEVVTEEELAPLEITESAPLSGRIVATHVRIASGVTVSVPAGGWLELVALGDVLIESDARIEGVAGDAGASISIRAGGDLFIYGDVRSGHGVAGDARRGRNGNEGAAGGDLFVTSRGLVMVGERGNLASGDGGTGSAGWRGGPGGALGVLCDELLVADRPGRLLVGAGGDGGSGGPPGAGGDAGDVWLSHWDLRGDGFVDLANERYPLQGGRAGQPGGLSAGIGGRSLDRHSGDGAIGGWGWLEAGAGQPMLAIGAPGSGSQRGGAATAWGGVGGSVSRIGLARGAFSLTFGFLSEAGAGGEARAEGGAGGQGGGYSRPGDGGDGAAAGGNGGAGLTLLVALPSRGGAGGRATASGGTGQKGVDKCGPKFPPPGGQGSSGGSAESLGGTGGGANTLAGSGGFATSIGAGGGQGGSGRGGGRGGSGGDASARGGEASPNGLRGNPGQIDARPGADGAKGPDC